jgi:pimeloyl-ACP methyl ester carboxylesterase
LRISLLACLVLTPAFLAKPGQAQDEPAAKPLIQRYLDATENRKPEYRKQLIALGADGLRKAIAEYRFEKPAQTGTVKQRVMCPDGHVRPMWVYIPANYDPQKSYPLIVHMHGGVRGAPADADPVGPGQYELESWLNVLPENWRNELILLGVSAGVPQTGEDAMWWRNAGQKNVLHMIRETRRLLNIDDDRIFIEGHSDGASGAFGFAFRRPDTFAGFFPMNGHPLVPHSNGTTAWLENLKGSSIYAVNGGADQLYPAQSLAPVYTQALNTGASIEWKVHDRLGHQITPVLKEEVANILATRVAKQRRDRAPTTVDWTTDDPQTGRRAWLEITELLDLGRHNSAPANVQIQIPGRRVRLGVQLSQEAEAPTVDTVVAGSVAEKIGVKAGDVILKLDDNETPAVEDLLEVLGKKAPGDNFTLTVRRAGKEHTLKGQFEGADSPAGAAAITARVVAELAPGLVSIRVRNAGTVVLHVTPAMLDSEGKLQVVLVRADGKTQVLRAAAPVVADPAAILDAFEAGLDRKDTTIARLVLDIAGALEVKRKPKAPPQQEDDF